ncbi:ribbon-helix-helix protein, CopG family [Salinibacterium sp.]|uniref:ribbon-helix-helix protein, CopG family n=1 Tax=Salinibacterium sp. TaxID=1915057 RepID=UPI00286B7055|nr:ribbon-helix-helix protein, CopG family [Salinibacterium sp.]
MNDYDELARRAERGELPAIPDTVLVGAAAAASGRQMLLDATGANNIVEATQIALGRPRLSDAGHGPSPVWKVRATENLDAEVTQIAGQRGVTKSRVIREAVEEYLSVHA